MLFLYNIIFLLWLNNCNCLKTSKSSFFRLNKHKNAFLLKSNKYLIESIFANKNVIKMK